MKIRINFTKKKIIISVLIIAAAIVCRELYNYDFGYTPKYLHLYGKVDPRIGLDAITVNHTDKKQCDECCNYDIGETGYAPSHLKKSTGIVINKDGRYSVMIPINLKRIKRYCRWAENEIAIKFYYKSEKSSSLVRIYFYEKNEFKDRQEEFSSFANLKKTLNITAKIKFLKDWSEGPEKGKIDELTYFDDLSLLEDTGNYITEFPEDKDVVELEMNVTNIKYINTVEDAMKMKVD